MGVHDELLLIGNFEGRLSLCSFVAGDKPLSVMVAAIRIGVRVARRHPEKILERVL